MDAFYLENFKGSFSLGDLDWEGKKVLKWSLEK
jgi:hypothetical protein